MKIQALSYAIMIVLVLMLVGSEAHDPFSANSSFHYEERTTNDNGDDILARYAGDIDDTPVQAMCRTTAIQRARRPHIPHQHEWESFAYVSNSDENYKVTDWYTFGVANDNTGLPTSEEGFQYDGEFSYSVRPWDMDRGLKDVNEMIDDCNATCRIIAEKKCKNDPKTAAAVSYIPYHDPNYPSAE